MWVPPTEHRSWCSDPTVQPRREGRARVRDGRRSRCLSSEEATRLWCCVAASPGYRSPGRRGAVEPSTWKTASLVTNPWGGGQPQGNESDAGQDRPVSREERVGHRQCPRWSGYARQAIVLLINVFARLEQQLIKKTTDLTLMFWKD